MLNMEVPIQLPAPARRSGGLFTDVAQMIDTTKDGVDRLGSGVVHVPWGCEPVHLGNAEICVVSGETTASVEDYIIIEGTDTGTKADAINDYPDQVIHPPFKVVDGLRCSSISLPHRGEASIGDRLGSRMRLQMSKMMMAELVAGAASGGVSLLSEATDLGTAAMAQAIIDVETWLASVLHNGVGAVAVPVGLLHLAVEYGWVDPSTMRTRTGHYVIADAGFTGDPADPTSVDPASFSIFGFGIPGHAYSSPNVLSVASGSSHVDITDNVIEEIVESYAQIAFDPCTVGEVTVTFS